MLICTIVLIIIIKDLKAGLLTGCGKKMKIVRVLGGKLCGKTAIVRELCGIAQSCKQTNIRSPGPQKNRHGGIFG